MCIAREKSSFSRVNSTPHQTLPLGRVLGRWALQFAIPILASLFLAATLAHGSEQLDYKLILLEESGAQPNQTYQTFQESVPFQQSAQCCKVCKKGKACGNSCISKNKTCRKAKGCACDANE
jgi:hypothetical protein